jgi:hypothetical protein
MACCIRLAAAVSLSAPAMWVRPQVLGRGFDRQQGFERGRTQP